MCYVIFKLFNKIKICFKMIGLLQRISYYKLKSNISSTLDNMFI